MTHKFDHGCQEDCIHEHRVCFFRTKESTMCDKTKDHEIHDVCEDCGGTGEVSVSERVYRGEPHMAEIGSMPCHCQTKPEEDHDTN